VEFRAAHFRYNFFRTAADTVMAVCQRFSGAAPSRVWRRADAALLAPGHRRAALAGERCSAIIAR
jgi:hypothetical protein